MSNVGPLCRCHRLGGDAAELARRALLLRSPLMNQVEAYIQFKPGLIAADGKVTDESTKQVLQSCMNELHTLIVRVLTVLPREATD